MNFINKLRQTVVDYDIFQTDHATGRIALQKQIAELQGSPYHEKKLEEHDAGLEAAKTAALKKIADISKNYEQLLERAYQIDGAYLHGDRELLPLLGHEELKSMDKKHGGNVTMQRLIRAEAEKRNFSMLPITPKEYRQEGFAFIGKMAMNAISNEGSPARGTFVSDAAWAQAFTSQKQAADVSDFAEHFARYEAAQTLKIPPQWAE